MAKNIIKRAIFEEISRYLYEPGIIVLHGARQVGKTHILFYLKDYLTRKGEFLHYIDLEDSRLVEILDLGVDNFIRYLGEEGFNMKSFSEKKKLFILIDEIQYLKDPSSFLKIAADHHKSIKLIISGSSSFAIKSKFRNSLVGRTADFEIFPLSFEEYLVFKNYSFSPEVLRKNEITKKKQEELKELFREYVLFGGYPKIALTAAIEMKEKYLQQIIDTYVRKDIRDLAGVKDIEKFNKMLEALASQSGQLLNVAELSNTCKISKQTVEKYLFFLENTYVLKLVRPYSKNIRSELFKTPKIFFYDSGIAQLLWLKSLQKEILGNIFETAVFSELAKKYSPENIFYWRTSDGKEIDFIVRRDREIVPIEAKLNFQQFKKKPLEYFSEKYKIKKYFVTALEGDRSKEFFVYPWRV